MVLHYSETPQEGKSSQKKQSGTGGCIKRESNPRRVELFNSNGNDPGYHYPINALMDLPAQLITTSHRHRHRHATKRIICPLPSAQKNNYSIILSPVRPPHLLQQSHNSAPSALVPHHPILIPHQPPTRIDARDHPPARLPALPARDLLLQALGLERPAVRRERRGLRGGLVCLRGFGGGGALCVLALLLRERLRRARGACAAGGSGACGGGGGGERAFCVRSRSVV